MVQAAMLIEPGGTALFAGCRHLPFPATTLRRPVGCLRSRAEWPPPCVGGVAESAAGRNPLLPSLVRRVGVDLAVLPAVVAQEAGVFAVVRNVDCHRNRAGRLFAACGRRHAQRPCCRPHESGWQ